MMRDPRTQPDGSRAKPRLKLLCRAVPRLRTQLNLRRASSVSALCRQRRKHLLVGETDSEYCCFFAKSALCLGVLLLVPQRYILARLAAALLSAYRSQRY